MILPSHRLTSPLHSLLLDLVLSSTIMQKSSIFAYSLTDTLPPIWISCGIYSNVDETCCSSRSVFAHFHGFRTFCTFIAPHTVQWSSERICNAFRCIPMIFATSDHANAICFDRTTYTLHFALFHFSLVRNTSQSFWHPFPFKYGSFQLISLSQFIIFHLALLLLHIYSDFILILLVLLRIHSQLIALLWGIVLYLFHIIFHHLASHNSPLSCGVLSHFAILCFYSFWLLSCLHLFVPVPHTLLFWTAYIYFDAPILPYHSYIIPLVSSSFPL